MQEELPSPVKAEIPPTEPVPILHREVRGPAFILQSYNPKILIQTIMGSPPIQYSVPIGTLVSCCV